MPIQRATGQTEDGAPPSIVPPLFLYCSSIDPLLAGMFFHALQGREPEAAGGLAVLGSDPEASQLDVGRGGVVSHEATFPPCNSPRWRVKGTA